MTRAVPVFLALALCGCAKTSKELNVIETGAHREHSQERHFESAKAGSVENSAADSVIVIKTDTLTKIKYYGITKTKTDTISVSRIDTIYSTKTDNVYISKSESEKSEQAISILDGIFLSLKWIVLAFAALGLFAAGRKTISIWRSL